MPTLLLIDDEANVIYSLQAGLESDELTIISARTAKQGFRLVEQKHPDVILIDVRLPDMNGLEAFEKIKELDPRIPVIVITAFATTETAIEAMKRGAFEYLLKPVDLHQLREIVTRALELRRMQNVPTRFDETAADAVPGDDVIVGQSLVMQQVYKAIGRIASQDVAVLILGESGTGKELVARAIYQHSKRTKEPFLAINCAAIPDSLLESELFGHEKGAFTGADRQRVGKFEQANGGTLFLDEIGDMTPTTQAKVLRLLQEQQFERIGGQQPIRTDVRIIAATNQDLEAMSAAGKFRQDLIYRLNGYTITLPPLRERIDDIPLLVEHFLRLANIKLEKHVHAVAPEAMSLLTKHPWPGNVRELQNVVRYGVIQAVGEILTPDDLPTSVRGRSDSPIARPAEELPHWVKRVRELLDSGAGDIYRTLLHEFDAAVLQEVLRHVNGNQVHASELLGISRTTLRSKLESLDHPPSEPSGP
ncbi:sigma-54-dependent transcriptional regulator [Tuwongella immobilis]|uniref:DNA-binding transcriptional regulator NtrC n=1 Tax=Tuwongella immobilis TaxID=692036 RepID=A0A6C2YR00_9BACT|nr:sigma-54 dependent transcriptional regulator [Tuwongella immobilis]VIP03415.1 response regulator with -like aaa-type and dna-binding domains : Response regulator with CheY-like receiver, AAA-type ATPase, and DNA-binding domains OS=Singulisphaera acidiphila (strain ATCC BAA-1392 / DSM 18658 / VKM B-2454 / MOB10) GN=Sinac_0782 PE=4 SV=1: Response_reg: Sigma54_activat: HTH_8 [Tuwongella immobilis]VTS04202.1 response regulator with -like aaa-type and dna-binding domains : Response regulator with C